VTGSRDPMARFGLRPRLTARLRLTLLYGALFLTAGVVLIGLSYVLMQRSLKRSPQFVLSTAVLQEALATPGAGGQSAPTVGVVVSGTPAPVSLAPVALRREQKRIRDATLRELLVQSSIALGAMTVASAGLGWWFAGRALRPVHDITAVARRLS